MYTSHFNLKDSPFSITPDPGYLYMSPHHQEALGHLLYGAGQGADQGGGFVQITGEVGTGKTTLIRALLEQDIEGVDVALILNSTVTEKEFLASVCDELRIEYPRDSESLKPLVDALNEYLLKTHAAGRRTVLIIDEAQNLSRDVLEQIRLLTNLETHTHKLLRIMLVGQPELKDMLARKDLRQLAQRITARYHLTPLNRSETMDYVAHRLEVAGGRRSLFSTGALRAVHKLSGGIPRLINIICDRALLGAYAAGHDQVDAKTIKQAAREALGDYPVRKSGLTSLKTSRGKLFTAASIVLLLALALSFLTWFRPADTTDEVAGLQTEAVDAAADSSPSVPAADAVESENTDTAVVLEAPPPITETEMRSEQSSPRPVVEENSLLKPLTHAQPDAALLKIWGLPPAAPAVSLCSHARNYGLNCLRSRGGWSRIRLLNRPVILTLKDGSQTHYVLATEMQGNQVSLESDEGTATADTQTLDPFWTGEYLLLWKPASGKSLIKAEDFDDAVIWLRRGLARIDGTIEPEPPSAYFDELLTDRVKAFQRSKGLSADGLAGAQTQILLNNQQPKAGTPRLSQQDKR